MPNFKTLFQTALHHIVQHLDAWSADATDRSFEFIPPKFVEVIFSTACENGHIKKRHLELFLVSRLNKLDLSQCSLTAVCRHWSMLNVTKIIEHRCRNLTELNIAGLSGYSDIGREGIISMISVLHHLEILNLSRTSCDDQVLVAIAQHCFHMRELDISHNILVSDHGINCLCSDESGSTVISLTLQKILLDHTSVGFDAIKGLLKCKQIVYIGFHKLMTIIQELHPEYLRNVPKEEQYALTNMTCSTITLKEQDDIRLEHAFRTVVAYCPNVVELFLLNQSNLVTGQHIRFLISLEKLKKLRLNAVYSPTFFRRALSPFLEVRGEYLTELIFEDVIMVNFEVVGYCCPKLIRLSYLLSWQNESFLVTSGRKPCDENPIEQLIPNFNREMNPKPFSSLKHLSITIACRVALDVGSDVVELLLAHSVNLETLKMESVNGLSDDVLAKILMNNNFSKLSKLFLNHCKYITRVGVKMFLDAENPLEQLCLFRCQHIGLRDASYFRRLSKRKNWNLEVDYLDLFPEDFWDDLLDWWTNQI